MKGMVSKKDRILLVTELVRQYNILACPKMGIRSLRLRDEVRKIK